jgi:ABC-type transporter Mla maintaining outer membrane lipid asymmetry ATPase subunit MlaF
MPGFVTPSANRLAVNELADPAQAGAIDTPDCPRHCPRTRSGRIRSKAPAYERPVMTDESPIIIELKDVHRQFGDVHVLNGLNLEIRKGTSTVIMGESGSGKSVLIRLMNGLSRPDSGTVSLFGMDTSTASTAAIRKQRLRIATLFQSYALLDSRTVEQNVAFPLTETGRATAGEVRPKVMETLDMLGLADASQLMPAELSGGMKKRVGLARALITSPEVLLFDEPTTGLDPVMIEKVDQMLLDIRSRYQLTMVIISHDMASAFKLGDTLAMLEKGVVTWRGTPAEALQTTHASVKRFVGAATSRLEDVPAGDAASATVTAASQPTHAEAEEVPTVARAAETAESTDAGMQIPADAAVVVSDVWKSFGDRAVLRGVNFWVGAGQVTTLIGGSGSGKTVMMKHILGLLDPTRGAVTVFGRDLQSLSRKERILLRLKFGMLFQGAALFDSMTVLENVCFPLIESPVKALSRRQAEMRAGETLERLKVSDLAGRLPSEISGGQRKRVGLARAIVTGPELMIYDEPTTGLDPVMTAYVNDMIVEAQKEFGTTTLVVSHDMASTFRISHRVAMLAGGEIVAFGTPDEVRRSERPEVRAFIHADQTDVGRVA